MNIKKLLFLNLLEKLIPIGTFIGKCIYAYKYKDPIQITSLSMDLVNLIGANTSRTSIIQSTNVLDSNYDMLIREYAENNCKKHMRFKANGINSKVYIFDEYFIIDMGTEWLMRADNDNLVYRDTLNHIIDKHGGNLQITTFKDANHGYGKLNIEKDDLYESKVTKRTLEIVEKLNKYYSARVPRSILFYGAPGSGKSTLIKSICSEMNLNTFRVSAQHMSTIKTKFYKLISDHAGVNALIIEDIDKITFSVNMLEIIDAIKNNLDFIFFSANDKGNINEAFMRMERVDEIIEINGTDIETGTAILGNEEIATKMQNFPIVCLLELSKRMKVLGEKEGYEEFIKDSDRIQVFLNEEEERSLFRVFEESNTDIPQLELPLDLE